MSVQQVNDFAKEITASLRNSERAQRELARLIVATRKEVNRLAKRAGGDEVYVGVELDANALVEGDQAEAPRTRKAAAAPAPAKRAGGDEVYVGVELDANALVEGDQAEAPRTRKAAAAPAPAKRGRKPAAEAAPAPKRARAPQVEQAAPARRGRKPAAAVQQGKPKAAPAKHSRASDDDFLPV